MIVCFLILTVIIDICNQFNQVCCFVLCCLQILVIISLCQGRTNLPPEKVPWDAFRTLISQCIYGGKIDNEFDQVSNFPVSS